MPTDAARVPVASAASPAFRRLLALTVLAVVLAFLWAMLVATNGRFVPQVVDLYLVAQYAKGFASGHPFQYFPGDPPTTGSTSLLYTGWLGLLYALGAKGEGLVAAAIVTGALLYATSVALALRVGRRLAGEREGLLAGGLVALGGPVVWGFLYGSDSALFLFLALLLFDRWLQAFATGRFSGFAVAASLLALARPEGLVLAVLLATLALVLPSPGSRRERLRALLPVAVAMVPLGVQRALTGQWLSTSVAEKSLLASYGTADTVALVSGYAVDVIRGLLLGFYPSESRIGFARGFAPLYSPPLALGFVLVALATMPPVLRSAGRAFVAVILAVGLLAGANTFMGVHFNRYLLWTFPILLTLAAVGLGRTTALLARDDSRLERALFRSGALLFLLLGLFSTAYVAVFYGSSAGDIARRELPLAAWIRGHLRPGVAIANAATSVEFLTGHKSVNLHGVTSAAFAGNRTAEREAGTFESLSRLGEAERPSYLITAASLQAGSALMAELADGPPLFATTSLGDELLLFRLRSDLPGRQARWRLETTRTAVARLQEVDRLNICDVRDEAAHAYTFASRLGELPLHGTVRIADYGTEATGRVRVADGGRAILGHERFRVRSRGGRDLVVVMRTSGSVEAAVLRASGSGLHSLEIPESQVAFTAGGQAVGRLILRPGPGWSEAVFTVPAAAVGAGGTELVLEGRYASFFFWFYQ